MNEKEFELEKKRVQFVYGNLSTAIAAIFALSLIIYLTFDKIVDETVLTAWLVITTAVLLLRAVLLISYKKAEINPQNIKTYYNLYYIGLVLSAVIWASTAFVIFPQQSEYQVLLILLTGGLLSGASASMISKIELFYTYLVIVIVPYLYVFYTLESQISTAIFLAQIFYAILLTMIARKSSNYINTNFRLSIENLELLHEQKLKINEVKRASEAKSKFLSVMSHEIRTPMNAIIGFIKILKQDEKDSTKLKYLETVDKSSYLLLNILNDILDLSKIESGKYTIERIAFNPAEEFEAIFDLFSQVGKEKNLNFVNSISLELPKTIISDKLRLKQIISNLLSNAVKFTPSGKKIELIATFYKESSSLYVEVVDEGVGIAEENIEKILEEFTQADDSTTRVYGGTGLGLSIANKLLGMFGTKLHVKSELGAYSSFSFRVNVDLGAADSKSEAANEVLGVDFSAKRVLVAEDNKTNQMLMEIILEEMNLDVTIANDGEEAEKLFKNGRYDIVLMDINMPNKNGIEAMIAIREYEKLSGVKIPIIALTANAVSGDKEQYIEVGFDDYLAKPIENRLLINVLKKYI